MTTIRYSQLLSEALPAVLTVSDIASLLQKSSSTVYRMIWNDEIPSVTRIGGKIIRFDRDAVLNWLRERGDDDTND